MLSGKAQNKRGGSSKTKKAAAKKPKNIIKTSFTKNGKEVFVARKGKRAVTPGMRKGKIKGLTYYVKTTKAA